MALTFSFKFKPKPIKVHRLNNRKIVIKKATGTIIKESDESDYAVLIKLAKNEQDLLENANNSDYIKLPLTEDSYNTKNKTNLWIKNKKTNKYIRIIRNEVDAKVNPYPNIYTPFRAGYVACGSVVRIEGKLYFRLVKCLHQQEIDEHGYPITAITNAASNLEYVNSFTGEVE